MKRITTITRPGVMPARVAQGIVLDVLEKQLRNAVGNLNLGENKSQEEE